MGFRKPIIFSRTFFPSHSDNKMEFEGDLKNAREHFFVHKPSNLFYLIKSRFDWMNEYTDGKGNIIEVGAGAGFSKSFIRNPNLKLTDFHKNDWIDMEVDALKMPFEDNQLDVIIASHMIHHLATPRKFFEEVKRVLKPGGHLLINEINTSTIMRLLLYMMKHEGYSYDVNVFDADTIANDPKDPWSANCAIPQMLFDNDEIFQQNFSGLEIIRNEPCEFMIFPLSGGVVAKARVINLPFIMLEGINWIDRLLISIAPDIFAMARRVVIRKI